MVVDWFTVVELFAVYVTCELGGALAGARTTRTTPVHLFTRFDVMAVIAKTLVDERFSCAESLR